jgi:hypothetical protein
MSNVENLGATASDGKPEKVKRPRPKLKVVPVAKPARTRELSSIVFPYRDMENAISVAEGLLKGGGVGLTTDQLAGQMGLQPGSGNFVLKVAAARIFGLIVNAQGKYELTNTGFAILDKDEKRQRSAKVDAFLNVPLFRRVYEEFKGKQLPPRPHGLEQALVKFGVTVKQKEAARLILEKSAAQSGFFATDVDRLIMPILAAPTPQERTSSYGEGVEAARAVGGGGGMGPPPELREADRGRHPFIQGLLKTLPEPETNWTIEGRAKWLQAAANIFDLMYKGSGEIQITAVVDRQKGDDAGQKDSVD